MSHLNPLSSVTLKIFPRIVEFLAPYKMYRYGGMLVIKYYNGAWLQIQLPDGLGPRSHSVWYHTQPMSVTF